MEEETYEGDSYGIGAEYESSRTVMIADDSVEERISQSEAMLERVQDAVDDLGAVIDEANAAIEALVNVLTWKGAVDTVGLLPDDADVGDVYHVTLDGSEWAWDGTQWQQLGVTLSLENYYTQDEVDGLLAAKANAQHTQSVANGGTGASTASGARANLGLGETKWYTVASYGDTVDSNTGATLTYPCCVVVTSTNTPYRIDSNGW